MEERKLNERRIQERNPDAEILRTAVQWDTWIAKTKNRQITRTEAVEGFDIRKRLVGMLNAMGERRTKFRKDILSKDLSPQQKRALMKATKAIQAGRTARLFPSLGKPKARIFRR